MRLLAPGCSYSAQNILICLLIIFQLTEMIEENKSSGIWSEEREHLVIKKGSTYVCSGHFISEDSFLGCSDSCSNPGGCFQSQKWKSVYEQSNKRRSLRSLASQRSLIKPPVCDPPKYFIDLKHHALTVTCLLRFMLPNALRPQKIPCRIIRLT